MRQEIFKHLAREVAEKGSLTRAELTNFQVNGKPEKLIDRNKGIWNPSHLLATLSIMSKPDSQYQDQVVGESLYAYAYREGNINGDNKKLRRAYELQLPVILLRWIKDGVYVPVFPVYVITDDMKRARFILALDEQLLSVSDPLHLNPLEREYAQRLTKQRLHQPEFRARVLMAYNRQCAVCDIGHAQLLDAAHIIADNKDHGSADVDNGLSLCKIHHAAYDANLIGISPTYKIYIGAKLMEDPSDASMLRHGLQRMNGTDLTVPKRRQDQPSRERLAERFGEFDAA